MIMSGPLNLCNFEDLPAKMVRVQLTNTEEPGFGDGAAGAKAHRVKSSPSDRPCGRIHGMGLRWGEGYAERLEKPLRRVLRPQTPGPKPKKAREAES